MDLSADLVDNRGLFTDHYLEEVLDDRPGVENLVEDADDALEQAKGKYEEKKSELAEGTNEEQTVKRFITPILDEVLGWSSIVRQTVQGEGESYGEPDYALFSDSEVRDEASARASSGEYDRAFRHATALAEAKRWHLSLKEGGKSVSDDRAPSEGAPGAQVFRYFQWTGVSWGILTNGNKWRLYTSRVPSPADTYLELNLEKILEQPHGPEEDPTEARSAFRLFYLLFHAESFREDPTLGKPFIDAVFEESIDRGRELENELTERVFDKVFVTLATGFFEDWSGGEDKVPSGEVLDSIYRATLRLLYRLLFLLYAEDRGLLPVHDRKGYYQYSLSKIAKDAREEIHEGQVIIGDDLWGELQYLFGEIISTGNSKLNVPTYNGDLFDVGGGENAWLDQHTVPDKRLAPALTDLTLVNPDDPDSRGVDYKALDVRQLGSIYEGLLEHRLRYAEEDTALVKENDTEVYKPHSALSSSESPSRVVEEGELYLETDESERKKTGSYYTPHHVVEYIVENTLRPVLDERIEQFENLVEEIGEIEADQPPSDTDTEPDTRDLRRQARDALLSIRVCDPAMGSGHFLVHAVDYMTNRIGAVALNRGLEINPVREILDEMREEILESLENQDVKLSDVEDQLDDFTLLRRIVMKRCIYGVDIHRMAVELSQLSLWLRSFTIGAPLSFLKHHLKQGNSLIGTTTDELKRALLQDEEGQFEMLGQRLSDRLKEITEQAQGIIQLSDATFDQVKESDKRFREYENESLPLKRVLDLWMSRQFGNEDAEKALNQAPGHVLDVFQGQAGPRDEEQRKVLEAAIDQSEERSFFHWELEFPEVYLNGTGGGQRAGFDAVIGNPPYSSKRSKEMKQLAPLFEYGSYRFDPFGLFLEQGFDLSRDQGCLGLIIPTTWTGNENYTSIRKMLLETKSLDEVIIFEDQVFDDANIDTSILTVRKSGVETDEYRIDKVESESLLEANPVGKPYDLIRNSERFDIPPVTSSFWAKTIVDLYGEAIKLGEIADRISLGLRVESVEENVSSTQSNEYPNPIFLGSEIERYGPLAPQSYFDFEGGSIIGGTRDPEVYDHTPKILLQSIRNLSLERRLVPVVDEEGYHFGGNVVGILLKEEVELDAHYLQAVIASNLINQFFRHRFTTISLTSTFLSEIPIRDIEFTTDADEREAHVSTLIDAYKAARAENADPAATLDATTDHLDSGRADVVHDLLAHLAQEMTDLKGEHQELEGAFDPFKYLPRRTASTPFSKAFTGEIKYAELLDAPVGVTSAQHSVEALRLVRDDGDWVLEARLKKRNPDDWQEWQKDDGSIIREWVPVLRFSKLDEKKARFYRFALAHLASFSNEDNDFSGTIIPGGYTSTVKERVWDTPVPVYDSSVDLSDLVELEQELQETERQIQFTDALIDQVVYRLYGLTEDEIRIVEQAV